MLDKGTLYPKTIDIRQLTLPSVAFGVPFAGASSPPNIGFSLQPTRDANYHSASVGKQLPSHFA
jgi:hypothetical protein